MGLVHPTSFLEIRTATMPNYDLERLGSDEFEHLFQALLKKVIGLGTVTFGAGADGAREATFLGRGSYPAPEKGWTGHWIFQAKFHDVRLLGPDKARAEVLKDLKSELHKVTQKYKHKCDNYILATNVPLSSVHEVGTHDRIASEVLPEFSDKIKNIHVWGCDEICRFLDLYPDVRQPYLHLLTPGDLIAELMSKETKSKSDLAETVQLYVHASFDTEQYSQLDQAGEVGEKPLPLRRVFVDLDVSPRSDRDARAAYESHPELAGLGEKVSASKLLLMLQLRRVVLIGGPGQGKSTLGQFIAQIHRAHLLQKHDQLVSDPNALPAMIRVPFRVILKDYAQWISETQGSHALERYVAELVTEKAARVITSEQLQAILKSNPCLLILDGLDEVTDEVLRTEMLQLVSSFVARAETLKANLQIMATSRKNNYTDQFDPVIYLHFSLVTMDRTKVLDYTDKWIKAKALDGAKAQFLRSSIKDCIEDSHFSPLMNTPLQVTIFILIILNGGTPPRQREELFNEYLEVIYKRERAKSKTIIQTEKRLLFGLHQYMGYVLHRRAAESKDLRSRMKLDEFASEVFRYLRHQDPISVESELEKTADKLIKEAHDRLVLLVEVETGYFGFELRSIQEFFAAAYLTDTAKNNKQRFERFAFIGLPPNWHNVALFFAGRVGRTHPGEAAQILEVCREIDRNQPDMFIKRGAWLALDIAVDRSFGPARMLQRSALEYGLTILDGEMDEDATNELVTRLAQLPKEDLQQLVFPILLGRMQKLHGSDDPTVVNIYVQLGGAKADVEAFVLRALAKGPEYAEALFAHTLGFGLSAKFVSNAFSAMLAAMSPQALVNALAKAFRMDSFWVVALIRSLPTAAQLAKQLFELGVPKGVPTLHSSVDDIFPVSIKSSDIPVQMAASWRLLQIVRDYRYMTSYMAARAKSLSSDVINRLSKYALDSELQLEFRSMCVAVVSRSVLWNYGEQHIAAVAARLVRVLAPSELERMDHYLYLSGAPGLHTLAIGLSGERGRRTVRRAISRSAGKGIRKYSIVLYVLEALGLNGARSVLSQIEGSRPPTREEFAAVLYAKRLGGFYIEKDIRLSRKAFSVLLSSLSLMLNGSQDEEWRVWAVVGNVGYLSVDRDSEGFDELKASLDQLCSQWESRLSDMTDRWEIANLIGKICELPYMEQSIHRLLHIMAEMKTTEGGEPDGIWPAIDKATFQRLQAIAETDDKSFRGFLKISSPLLLGRRNHPDFENETMQSDISRAVAAAKTTAGAVQKGAIIFLAENANKDLSAIAELLRCSAKREIPEGWIATLIRGTAHQIKPNEAVSFLLPIFADAQEYPQAIRAAALDSLRDVVKLLSYELPESSLGLPFET